MKTILCKIRKQISVFSHAFFLCIFLFTSFSHCVFPLEAGEASSAGFFHFWLFLDSFPDILVFFSTGLGLSGFLLLDALSVFFILSFLSNNLEFGTEKWVVSMLWGVREIDAFVWICRMSYCDCFLFFQCNVCSKSTLITAASIFFGCCRH